MKKFLTTVSWDTMECQESEKLVATILKKKKKKTTIIYKKNNNNPFPDISIVIIFRCKASVTHTI